MPQLALPRAQKVAKLTQLSPLALSLPIARSLFLSVKDGGKENATVGQLHRAIKFTASTPSPSDCSRSLLRNLLAHLSKPSASLDITGVGRARLSSPRPAAEPP